MHADSALLMPVFAQIGLTFVLLFAMAYVRFCAISRREVRVADIALGQRAWPARATQIANAFQNQLELPVLFYVLVALVLITRTGNATLLALAWGFVASRIVHALVHTTSNRVPMRFFSYLVGVVLLAAMWIVFALRFAGASGLVS
jgi:hypothetical protein